MVRTDNTQTFAVQESHSTQHLLAEDGMRLHQTALGIGEGLGLLQDVVRDPDLADVVQEEPVHRARIVDQAGLDHSRELGRVPLHALRVLPRARVLRLERAGQG